MAEDDPEKCSYVPLTAELEELVRTNFVTEFERAVERFGLPSDTVGLDSIGLESVSSSTVQDQEGERWLRFFATDSTSWYLSWDGDAGAAISLGGDFAEALARSFST